MRIFFKMMPDDGGPGPGAGGGGGSPGGSAPSSPSSGNGASPSPSPATSSEGGSQPAQTGSSSSLPFIEIPDLGDLDGMFVEAPGAKPAQATPAADGTVIVPPGTHPPAQPQAAPAQPGAQPAQAPQGGAQPPPAPQPAPAASQPTAPYSEQLAAQMAAIIPQMAEADGFRLTEEEVAELDTNPVMALQKAQARTYVNTLRYFHRFIENEMPKMVRAQAEQMFRDQEVATQTRTKVTGMLKQQFPAIDPNNAEHAQALATYTRAVRAGNPQASLEQVIHDVGMLVLQRFKLGSGPVAQQPQPKPAPMFVPANGGTQNGTGGTPPPPNPFEGLAQNFDE